MNVKTYFGFVTILGKPNVGKSTLLNNLIKKKVSITSKKPNTTLKCTLGIYTKNIYQIVYIDTPGLEKDKNFFISENNIIKNIQDTKLIIFVVENLKWNYNDEFIFQKIKKIKKPILIVLNKIDLIKQKKKILPYIKNLNKKYYFKSIIPLSAKKDKDISFINCIVEKYLDFENHFFSKDSITTHTHPFLVSEIIREKLIRFLGDELPYLLKVNIETFLKKNDMYLISANILVKKTSQKKIVIGKNGNKIKLITKLASHAIYKFFNKKVILSLWVKIKP